MDLGLAYTGRRTGRTEKWKPGAFDSHLFLPKSLPMFQHVLILVFSTADECTSTRARSGAENSIDSTICVSCAIECAAY
jgi:hypothetical protein